MVRYRVIRHIFVFPDSRNLRPETIFAGEPCRYCDESNRKFFRNRSHSLPKSLGNNRAISGDECDECNTLFSDYEDHLVQFFGNLRTIFGTPNRDSYPTGADSNGKLRRKDNQISMITNDNLPPSFSVTSDGSRRVDIPLPMERYSPYKAFLAAQKCAFALLDTSSLPGFEILRNALRFKQELPKQLAEVTISKNQIGTKFFAGILFTLDEEKSQLFDEFPRFLFNLCVANYCLSFALLDDETIENRGKPYRNKTQPTLVIRDQEISYGGGQTLDWSGMDLVDSPFCNLVVHI